MSVNSTTGQGSVCTNLQFYITGEDQKSFQGGREQIISIRPKWIHNGQRGILFKSLVKFGGRRTSGWNGFWLLHKYSKETEESLNHSFKWCASFLNCLRFCSDMICYHIIQQIFIVNASFSIWVSSQLHCTLGYRRWSTHWLQAILTSSTLISPTRHMSLLQG